VGSNHRYSAFILSQKGRAELPFCNSLVAARTTSSDGGRTIQRSLFMALLGALTVITAQAQVVTESFMNSTAPGWVMAGTGYTPNLTSGGVDPAGAGWLRLTSTGADQATSAYYNTAFSSANATIYASFEYASWGGNGADGMTFFLFDGSQTFGVGANGGSLGYAQKTGVNGLNGGYLGVAIDEYGNFSSGTEGRSCDRAQHQAHCDAHRWWNLRSRSDSPRTPWGS